MDPLRRSLLSLLLIASSSATAWWAIGARTPPPPPRSGLVPVFAFAAEGVAEIAAGSWEGSMDAVRRGAGWSVRSLVRTRSSDQPSSRPSPQRVDEVLDGFVGEMTNLAEVGRFPRAGPWSDFGLEAPRAWVSFGLGEGRTVRLEIGDRTASGDGLYARVTGVDDVVQIGGLVLNQIAAVLFQLRGMAESG